MTPPLKIRPDKDEFDALAAEWPLVPVWTELSADVSTPVGVFPSLAREGPGVLLESVERSERWGRYSFVAGDPAAVVTVDASGARVEQVVRDLGFPDTLPDGAAPSLRAIAEALRAPHLPGLPPLVGGLVGMLTYEAAELLDGHPYPGGAALPGPPIYLLVIDRAVVFDHWKQRLLLVCHAGDHAAAVDSLEHLAEHVRSAVPPAPEPLGMSRPVPSAPPRDALAFRESVLRAKEHIVAGDIFQVVLSRRRSVAAPDGGLPIYRRLRIANPSPYMFFLRTPALELAGSSPEPLVRVEGRKVVSRPIAGTYRRGIDEQEDARLEAQLLADPKELAEHAMLVDLARNDLGRVCRPGSVRPTELMQVERFSRVMHIVSTVEGELRDELSPVDALAATFPAGTVTGAPKRRAMEIIRDEEPVARGPYAGAVGYLTFAGDLDFCITIRTAVITGGEAFVQAGAGIVADSNPGRELDETDAKASALLAALGGAPAVAERIGATQ
ncbi:MAG: anthranilate synthase component I family protein [Actinomycetota bacterium]